VNLRVIWGIDRLNPSTPFGCRRRQEERNGKGREGKERSTKSPSGLYFTYLGSRSLWTDLNNNCRGCRSRWRNHSDEFWFQYFWGFQIYRGSKFPFSHWLCWSSSFVTTVRPLITIRNWEKIRCCSAEHMVDGSIWWAHKHGANSAETLFLLLLPCVYVECVCLLFMHTVLLVSCITFSCSKRYVSMSPCCLDGLTDGWITHSKYTHTRSQPTSGK